MNGMTAPLATKVRELSAAGLPPGELLQRVCDLLVAEMEACDWAGYYLVDPSSRSELLLGPYRGAPTEHVRIGFGRGVCGQAAEAGRTLVVGDVTEEPNYLACSPAVRSEIVVPVVSGGRLVGELDLDSDTPDAFGAGERALLEEAAVLTAEAVAVLSGAAGGGSRRV